MSLFCFSCSDLDELYSGNDGNLWLNFRVSGQDETTRAVDGVDALNENKLDHIDVFVGKGDDLSTYHKRFSDTLSTTKEGRLLLADKTWKTTFPSTGYDVYLVANAAENLSGVTSLATLKAKTQTDETIYKKYSTSDNANKLFLMDGKYTSWTPSSAKEDMITVELNRAAAKIVVNISLGTTMANSYTMDEVQWRYRNYETTASVLADGQGTLSAGTQTTGSTSISNGSDATIVTYSDPCMWTSGDDAPYLLVNIPLTKKSDSSVKDQNWYRIPVRDISNTSSDGKQLDRNHIYIVNATISSEGSATDVVEDQNVDLKYAVTDWITNSVSLYDLAEEHLYVTPTLVYMRNIATDTSIKYYASSQVEIVNKEVYYYDEYDDKQLYTDADLVTLTPENNSTDSYDGVVNVSSPIPDEEHAGAGTSSNLDAGKFTIRFIRFRIQLVSDPTKYEDVLIKQYPLEYIQNIKGWYSTRNVDGWIDWIRDSKAYTYRTKPKVYTGYYNTDNYNQDTNYPNNSWVNNPVDVESNYGRSESTETSTMYYINKVFFSTDESEQYPTSPVFNARVYDFDDNKIYFYSDVRQSAFQKGKTYTPNYESPGNYIAKKIYTIYNVSTASQGEKQYTSDVTNNAMYVIQLTRTSDKYVVAHPTMDSDGLTYDNVASPAFMLASQLGALQIISKDPAFNNYGAASTYQKFYAKHCATYREVGTDGTVYDNWRLPTRAEIGVICEYQPQPTGVHDDSSEDGEDIVKATGAPIETVLAGAYYPTANKTGGAYAGTGRTFTNEDYIWKNKNLGIRCVRDLSPEEVKKLDENKK